MQEWFKVSSINSILEEIRQWPDSILIGLFFVGPLIGLPFSIFLVAIGLVYPIEIALAILVATLAVHHVLIFWLSQTHFSRWLQERLRNKKLLRLPIEDRSLFEDALYIAMVAWVPGASYALKVAYTALSDISFRNFVFTGSLVQATAALPYLMLGTEASTGDLKWISIWIFVILLLTWLSKYAFNNYTKSSERREL